MARMARHLWALSDESAMRRFRGSAMKSPLPRKPRRPARKRSVRNVCKHDPQPFRRSAPPLITVITSVAPPGPADQDKGGRILPEQGETKADRSPDVHRKTGLASRIAKTVIRIVIRAGNSGSDRFSAAADRDRRLWITHGDGGDGGGDGIFLPQPSPRGRRGRRWAVRPRTCRPTRSPRRRPCPWAWNRNPVQGSAR